MADDLVGGDGNALEERGLLDLAPVEEQGGLDLTLTPLEERAMLNLSAAEREGVLARLPDLSAQDREDIFLSGDPTAPARANDFRQLRTGFGGFVDTLTGRAALDARLNPAGIRANRAAVLQRRDFEIKQAAEVRAQRAANRQEQEFGAKFVQEGLLELADHVEDDGTTLTGLGRDILSRRVRLAEATLGPEVGELMTETLQDASLRTALSQPITTIRQAIPEIDSLSGAQAVELIRTNADARGRLRAEADRVEAPKIFAKLNRKLPALEAQGTLTPGGKEYQRLKASGGELTGAEMEFIDRNFVSEPDRFTESQWQTISRNPNMLGEFGIAVPDFTARAERVEKADLALAAKFAAEPKFEDPVTDPLTGVVTQRNIRTNEVEKVFQPPGSRRTSIDRDGNLLIEEGPAAALGTATKNRIEEDLRKGQDSLVRLGELQRSYKRGFLKIPSRVTFAFQSGVAKFVDLNPEAEKELKEYAAFRSTNSDAFNKHVRSQTGAVMNKDEAGRIEDAFPIAGTGITDGDSPPVWEAKADAAYRSVAAAQARMHWVLRTKGLTDRGTGDDLYGIPFTDMPRLMTERAKVHAESMKGSDLSAEEQAARVHAAIISEFGVTLFDVLPRSD